MFTGNFQLDDLLESIDRELEELQRKQAEEEQRLVEEKQRRDRELQEQRARERIEELFKTEQSRLDEEIVELAQLVKRKTDEFTIIMENIQKEEEAIILFVVCVLWTRFIECHTLPRPKCERDVHTHLSLWKEERIDVENEPSLTSLFNQLPNADALLNQLETERAFAEDSRDMKNWSRIHGHMLELLEILMLKWDTTSQHILQHADYFAQDPNENFQLSKATENFAFGIWGNLTKNPRYKIIEFMDIKLSASLPKPLALSSVSIRMLYMTGVNCGVPFEVQEGLGHWSFVGGILMFDLSEMPNPPKNVDTWTIRQIASSNGNLKRLEYPFKTALTEVVAENDQTTNDSQMWSMHITFPIPSNVSLDSDSVKIMFWNSELKIWDDEGITDDDIDLEEGIVKCRTSHFAPTAVVQRTYSEFPYLDWMLEPAGHCRAILHIYGKKTAISIEIREGKCMVTQCGSEHVPRPLRNKWFPPSLLLKRLSHFGFNFRGPKSMKGVDIEGWTMKCSAVEETCIFGISQFISAMTFRRSPSNKLVSDSKCVFQFNNSASPTLGDWRSLLFDVNYQVKDKAHSVGFFTSDNNVTDATTFEIDNGNNEMVSDVRVRFLYDGVGSAKNISISNAVALVVL
ncbi:hypothetical protein BSLG_002200 [Batrachochytrium salamandrivorans]|nr:hypothetical protein BSLG_002200 [Batrachochytrium salamandrivorans]